MNMTVIIAILVLVAGLVGFIWTTYNSLVKGDVKVQEAWADIDVQLKNRYDLLPDLVESVKKATRLDEDILTKVTELRSRAMEDATKNVPLEERAKVENQLTGAIRDIKVQVEAYPDIKSHAEIMNLMEKLTEIEDKIVYSRRYYNASVKEFNTMVKMFPAVLVARFMGFSDKEFFAASEEERQDVKVDLDVDRNTKTN